MTKRNLVRLFEARKGHLDSRVKRDYIRNGIATIPCRITDYYDVISNYSPKGFETLNPDFVDYLSSSADVTPASYPLVVNIIGDCLSEEEKKTIHYTILDECGYQLGIVEKENKRHLHTFLLMILGLVATGVILWVTKILDEVPRELLFILFWFMGETLCDYVFLSGYEVRHKRQLAGRLASIRVVFSDHYEEPNYTENDLEKLYSEIERDVSKTIRDEEKEEL